MTMVEILVVVLLLGLAVSVIALNMDNVTPKARIFASARELGTTMEYLRNEALVQKRYLFLVIDFEKSRYHWARAPEVQDARENLETDSEFSEWTKLHRGVQFEDVTFDDGGQKSEGVVWAPFNPNGLPQGFVVHVINEEGRRVSAEINGLTGTVRVTEGYKEIPKVEESMFE
jgi:Tfp pilus assembly protein FimT